LPGVPYELKNPIGTVVSNVRFELALEDMRKCTHVGLDVETALDFVSVCLIQIATPRVTWVFDALALEDLAPLKEIFESNEIVKLIHNARFERRALAKLGFTIENVVDTLEVSRDVRGRHALGGHGLAAVAERELGVALDKSEQTSNWARRPLSEEQLRYAAADAEILLLLFERHRQG